MMEIYLPMKKCIRTKVHLTKEHGIVVYQQNREPKIFNMPSWRKTETKPEHMKLIKRYLKEKHLSDWPHNFHLLK